jgi:hypothetical protein
MTTTSNDLSGYTVVDLRNTIPHDKWSVRDEAMRRSDKLAKKIAAQKEKLAKLIAEQVDVESVFNEAIRFDA